MKTVPSSAIENGFTPQFTISVTTEPRQCRATDPTALRSTLSSIGTIISHTSAATTRFTRATSAAAIAAKASGNTEPAPMPTTTHIATHAVR